MIDLCGTFRAWSKNAIFLVIARRLFLIPYSSMCDWSTPRVWPLFLSTTYPSPPTKPICRCELFSLGPFLFQPPSHVLLGGGYITLLLNDNCDFYLCPEAIFWFFSFMHVILKIDFNNEMQDQAAIDFRQFVDVQLDLGFWLSLISSFGLIWRLKISFPLSGTTNNLTPPSGTVWSTSVALFELAPKTLFF